MKIDRLRLLGLGGSNKIMQGELSRLAKRALGPDVSRALLAQPPQKLGPGGLGYPFSAELASVAVCYHRTSARVLWDLYASPANRLEPLYEELYQDILAETRPWLRDGLKFSVLAFGTSSVAAGDRQVVGVVKNALMKAASERGMRLRLEPHQPQLLLHARSTPIAQASRAGRDSSRPAEPGSLVVSLDLAGRPMHQRGYRGSTGIAPIREDLASNLVMLARHDPRRQVVIDPLAGSGTLLIEAALLAAARPLWMSGRRPLAVQIGGVSEQVAARRGPLFGDTRPALYAAERDAQAFTSLKTNAETAGVQHQLSAFAGDFRDWPLHGELLRGKGAAEPGLILSNPPYGSRLELSERELGSLYQDLGAWCRQFSGYRAGFLVGDAKEGSREPSVSLFLRKFGGKPRLRKPMANGPLRAQFLLYQL